MALTIEGATTGYDKSGVTALLNDIHAQVIEEAKSEMLSGKETLKTSIDDIWQGHSAKVFKDNLDTDVKNISNALDAAYEVLVSEITQIQGAMGQVDQELVKSR